MVFNAYASPREPSYQTNTGNSTYTDSFYYHYNLLDSISKAPSCPSDNSCEVSVRYCERVTDIKAHPDSDCFFRYCFTKMDLLNWLNWYKEHNINKGLKYFSKPRPSLPKALKP